MNHIIKGISGTSVTNGTNTITTAGGNSGVVFVGPATQTGVTSINAYEDELIKHSYEKVFRPWSGSRVITLDKVKVIEDMEIRIKAQQEYLDRLREKLKYVEENMQYNPGDVVIHTKFGNAVVQEIVLGKDPTDFTQAWEVYHDNVPVENLAYRIVSKDGKFTVRSEELMPYNESSKLLFEKR